MTLKDVLTAGQVIAVVTGALLALAAFIRSRSTEERSATREEVGDLWAENRDLRTENRTFREEIRKLWAELGAMRQEQERKDEAHEAEVRQLRRDHEDCQRQLAALRAAGP